MDEILKRIEYIDLAKGFCIILVVFYHSCVVAGVGEYPLHDATCIMRMPLYFFLSGLFFKPYENYRGFLIRKINKLLIPFLFFRIVSCVITPFVNNTPFEWHRLWDFVYNAPLIAPNTPIWFLMCLFWLNQMFYAIYKIGSKSKYPVAVIAILSLLLGIFGYELGQTPFNINAMNIGTAMTASPFFCAGYLFKKHTDILYPNKWDKYLPLFIAVCALYTAWLAKPADYFYNQYEANIWVTYTCALTGVLCIIFISKLINYLPLVSYFGRYSIMILVTHIPIVQRLTSFLSRYDLPIGWQIFICTTIVMLSYLILIPLMKEYLPYVTAQKDVIPVK